MLLSYSPVKYRFPTLLHGVSSVQFSLRCRYIMFFSVYARGRGPISNASLSIFSTTLRANAIYTKIYLGESNRFIFGFIAP